MSSKFRSGRNSGSRSKVHSILQKRQKNDGSCGKDQHVSANEDYETQETKNYQPLLL